MKFKKFVAPAVAFLFLVGLTVEVHFNQSKGGRFIASSNGCGGGPKNTASPKPSPSPTPSPTPTMIPARTTQVPSTSGLTILQALFASEDVTTTISQACNGQTDCTIEPANKNFTDPNPGLNKPFLVVYSCPGTATVSDSIPGASDDGSYLDFSCPTQTITSPQISVTSATYGTEDVSAWVSAFCNGSVACIFPISQSMLGDPDSTQQKPFDVTYSCTAGSSHQYAAVPAPSDDLSIKLDCSSPPAPIPTASPAANYYGAIAYDSITGYSAASSGYSSLSSAESAAKGTCGGCSIVTYEENECAALATDDYGDYGTSGGSTQSQAEEAATQECIFASNESGYETPGGCEVQASTCDSVDEGVHTNAEVSGKNRVTRAQPSKMGKGPGHKVTRHPSADVSP
jgi:hypothetical protein